MPDITEPPVAPVYLGNYRLENVYRKSTPEQRAEAVRFWLALGVMPEAEAQRRAHELVYLIRRSDDVLAGMCTVGLQSMNDGRTYYAYRMLIHPQDRVPYLMIKVINAARDYLRTFQTFRREAAGLLIVTENRKAMRSGTHRLLQRNGYEYLGRTPADLDLWLARFE